MRDEGNWMVTGVDDAYEAMFPTVTDDYITRQKLRIEEIADQLWLDPEIVGEAIFEGEGFKDFHNALLAGDTAEAGRLINITIENYINSIAEGRA